MSTKELNIKNILNYVQKEMYKPNINADGYYSLEKKIRYCLAKQQEEDVSANIIYARLLYQEGKYLESRNQYNCAKKKKPHLATIYYGLYKNYIMEENWEKAIENLYIYLNLIGQTKRTDGFNIIIALLSYLNNESIELEIPLDIYLSQDIDDQFIEECYEKLIDEIINGDYYLAIKDSKNLENYCRQKANYMEFITLEKILRSILIKNRQENRKNIADNIRNSLNTQDYENLYKTLEANLNSDFLHLDIMKYIPILIDNGFYMEAKDLINKMEYNTNNKKIRAYYRKKIRDNEIIAGYSEEEKKLYQDSIETIENALLDESYFDAFDMASGAFYKLDNPIFLYYMGLSAFYLEEYSEALSYFNAYNRRGANKAIESRFFAVCCYKNLGGGKKYRRRRSNYIRYANSINMPKSLNFNDYSYEPIDEEELEKKSMFTNLFANPTYVSIKNLFQQDNIHQAQAIINKIERNPNKTPEEKLALKYINANKKILLNQNK